MGREGISQKTITIELHQNLGFLRIVNDLRTIKTPLVIYKEKTAFVLYLGKGKERTNTNIQDLLETQKILKKSH